MKTLSKLLKLRKVARLLEKLSVLVILLMFQVSNLCYNKLSDVATATELVTALLLRKERRSVRLTTSCVQTVTEEDTSGWFASPDPNHPVNQMMFNQLKMQQQLKVFVLITPTTSVYQVRVEQ